MGARPRIDPATWQHLEDNLGRVSGLLNLYSYFLQNRRGRPSTPLSDVLRAATVFLHASLEEFLRGLAAQYWPSGGKAALDNIPLSGQERATKFTLGALVQHRSKTVEALLLESVMGHLGTSTFNNAGEIVRLLASIDVDADRAKVTKLLPEVEALMRRRHHIVHQADRNEPRARGQHRTKAISEKQVNRWLAMVLTFAARVTRDIGR